MHRDRTGGLFDATDFSEISRDEMTAYLRGCAVPEGPSTIRWREVGWMKAGMAWLNHISAEGCSPLLTPQTTSRIASLHSAIRL